jgi:hypothetical protein
MGREEPSLTKRAMTSAKTIFRAVAGLLLTLPMAAVAQDRGLAVELPPPPQVPLFASHQVLDFTLVTDIDALMADRSQDSEERPGEILLGAGSFTTLPVQVRTRGNFRLRRSTCSMPPIRLNFSKKQVTGTVFEGQDKIKVVTHCREGDAYERNLFEEYVAYRTYNLITDFSFRVRLVRITYSDTSGRNSPETRYAFLIEDEDALAERFYGQMLDVPSIRPDQYTQEPMLLMSLFEYMLGNTDWSMIQFHNVKLLRTAGGAHVPIPYDFDWAGLVSARYAEPNPTLGIRSVRQRLYRGFCVEGLDYQAAFQRFVEQKEAIYAMIRELDEMPESARREALEYYDSFYETIEDPDVANRNIIRACRPT